MNAYFKIVVKRMEGSIMKRFTSTYHPLCLSEDQHILVLLTEKNNRLICMVKAVMMSAVDVCHLSSQY